MEVEQEEERREEQQDIVRDIEYKGVVEKIHYEVITIVLRIFDWIYFSQNKTKLPCLVSEIKFPWTP